MIYALYSDGATYRVLYDPADRKTYLATTTGGRTDVPYTENGAAFVRFDFSYVPEKGLRATDVYDYRAKFRRLLALLTPPAKPADYVPPGPDSAESATRLHVEGQGFRALQYAGARATAAYQKQRGQQRRATLDALNAVDARKVAEARANATALAQRWNPKRPEAIPPTELTQEHLHLAEQARYRKRKIEPQES